MDSLPHIASSEDTSQGYRPDNQAKLYCDYMVDKAKEVNEEFNALIDSNITQNQHGETNYNFGGFNDFCNNYMENYLYESAAFNTLKSKNKIQLNQQKEIDQNNFQNKSLEKVIQELKDFEKVAATFIAKLDGTDTALNKEKEAKEIFEACIKRQKEQLKQINRENLKISYEIEDLIEKREEAKIKQEKKLNATMKPRRRSLDFKSIDYNNSVVDKSLKYGLGRHTQSKRSIAGESSIKAIGISGQEYVPNSSRLTENKNDTSGIKFPAIK